jgi:hypothetical protein
MTCQSKTEARAFLAQDTTALLASTWHKNVRDAANSAVVAPKSICPTMAISEDNSIYSHGYAAESGQGPLHFFQVGVIGRGE